MDFKTELQNLVNRYPGIVKSVKVKFVETIEVKPNGDKPIENHTLTHNRDTSLLVPQSPEAHVIASVMNARPPVLDTFDMAETRFPVEAKKVTTAQARKATANAADAAIKATMDALKPPSL